jgi:hypothetical protein
MVVELKSILYQIFNLPCININNEKVKISMVACLDHRTLQHSSMSDQKQEGIMKKDVKIQTSIDH